MSVISRIFSKVRMESILEYEDNLDAVLDRLVEIYNKTYPNHSYPLEWVYSKQGLYKAINRLRTFVFTYKKNIIGSMLIDVEGSLCEVFGYAVDPNMRGKGTAISMIKKINDVAVGLYKEGVTIVNSDIQLSAVPSLITTYITGAFPVGFWPNKRKIVNDYGFDRQSMYSFSNFTAPSPRHFNDRRYVKSRGIKSIFSEFENLYLLISSQYGGKTPKKVNPSLNNQRSVSVKVESWNIDDLFVDKAIRYSYKDNYIDAMLNSNDLSIFLDVHLKDTSVFESLLEAVLSSNKDIEFFSLKTDNAEIQKVAYNHGFYFTELNINGGKEGDLISLAKVDVSKEDVNKLIDISDKNIEFARNYVVNKIINRHKVLYRFVLPSLKSSNIDPLTQNTKKIVSSILLQFL